MKNHFSTISDVVALKNVKVLLVALDIRSAYNIGAMLRTADGTGQTALVFAGYSPTPENPKVAKTALGAENSVPWCRIENISSLLAHSELCHVGLELSPKANDLFTWTPDSAKKIAIYVGNEVTGLPVELMTGLETFVQIPMRGEKASLNVAEAASIAMYELLRKNL